jgi:hypothetical protein
MRIICAPREFKKEDEFDISPRLLEPPERGRAKGKSIAAFLPEMVDEYYREIQHRAAWLDDMQDVLIPAFDALGGRRSRER